MRHNHEREIDGINWTVNEFPATEGLKMLTALTRLVGGPLTQILGALAAGGDGVLDAKLDLALLGKAVAQLTDQLDEEHVLALAKRLLRETRADGKEVLPQFDLLFQARYLTLFKLLGFVVEVNYKVPLTGWLTAAAQQAAAAGGEPQP